MDIYKNTLAKLTVVMLFLCAVQVQAHTMAVKPQERNTLLQYLINTQPELANLLTKAGLTPVLSGDDAYTILIPSAESLKSLEGQPAQRVRTVLSGHILKGKYMESDLKDGASVETLAGTKITVCRKKDYTLVDGVRIVEANQVLKNGVVHRLGGMMKL